MSIAEAMTVTSSAPIATLRCNQHAWAKRRIQPGARSTSPATGLSVLIVFIEIHGGPGPRQLFKVMSRVLVRSQPSPQNRTTQAASIIGPLGQDANASTSIDGAALTIVPIVADTGSAAPIPPRSIASSTARTIHSPKTNHRMTERAPAIDEPVSSATPAPSSAHRAHARMPAAQIAKRSVVKLKSRPKSNIAPMLTTSTANA